MELLPGAEASRSTSTDEEAAGIRPMERIVWHRLRDPTAPRDAKDAHQLDDCSVGTFEAVRPYFGEDLVVDYLFCQCPVTVVHVQDDTCGGERRDLATQSPLI